MSKKRKYIVAPDLKEPVNTGLVDKNGLFLLLLDSDETEYFRFSSEHEAIEKLLNEVANMKALNDRLIARNDELEGRLERNTRRSIKRTKSYEKAMEYLLSQIPEEQRDHARLESGRMIYAD